MIPPQESICLPPRKRLLRRTRPIRRCLILQIWPLTSLTCPTWASSPKSCSRTRRLRSLLKTCSHGQKLYRRSRSRKNRKSLTQSRFSRRASQLWRLPRWQNGQRRLHQSRLRRKASQPQKLSRKASQPHKLSLLLRLSQPLRLLH